MILTLYSSYIREFLTLKKKVFTEYILKYLGKEKHRKHKSIDNNCQHLGNLNKRYPGIP